MLDALTDPPRALDWATAGTWAESPGALDLAPDTLAHPPPVSGYLASDAGLAAGQDLVDSWADSRLSVLSALDKGWRWMTRNHPAGPIQPGMGQNSMLLKQMVLLTLG